MRLLVTYPAASLSGAARYAASMSFALRRRGHDVTVALDCRGTAVTEFQSEPDVALNLVHIEFPNLRRNSQDAIRHVRGLFTGTRQLRHLIQETRADAVIGHCIFNMWTAAASASCNVPFFSVVHELPQSFPAWLYAPWAAVIGRTATQIMLVSAQIQSRFFAARTVVIPPGVDTRAFHPGVDGQPLRSLWLSGAAGPLVVCVSNLMPPKGQLDLLLALPEVARAFPGLRTVFVGGTNDIAGNDAFLTLLRERTVELQLERHVVFAGPRTDAANVYAAADVVVYPSHGESFGLVALEALAVGRAVVATSVGIAPTLAAGGAAVALVPPRDPNRLAAAIIDMLGRAPAAPFADRQWSLESAVDQVEALLRNARR